MSDKKFIFDSTITNDRIDIYGDIDVTIRKLQPTNENEFRIEIEGNSVDYSVVNALRRTVMTDIPIYAFHRSNIFIEVKKSRHMYNNDLIYNQIETLPIFDIPNHFDLENPEIFLPTDVMRNLFGNFIQEKYMEEPSEEEKSVTEQNKRLFKIELSINVKNNTGADKFVSTHDAVLKIDGKTTNSYLIRKPICILVLKPTEEISLRAEANLGISKMHASYEATTNAIHDEITPTKYHLWYETLEQLDKNLIFTKACIILTKKLENLRTFIKNKYTEERDVSEKIEIQLFGEEHTLGNLLATILQKCEFVERAGYYMPHPFINQITVSYQLNRKSKIGPIQVFIDCVDYLTRLFQLIAHAALKK
ncbi:dna directed rna polymerase subunit [Tupanvirus deep ocean]|uniref:Dna directed rna polymerase subunit n=2 Tax=Tupanvirus TaxID=2094720 RepID=A0AC62A927_9VIRU|nr:dna directed rna polymerase subunit [Tupanvirus deep ocean]QKU34173.1 dna directed rna polymerase subunit [Tupanvirus deep ocean]